MASGQTLQSHLIDASSDEVVDDELLTLLLDLVGPAREIAAQVNRAGLVDIFGFTGERNVHGEEVKKLDVYADGVIVEALRASGTVCGMASEENEEFIAPSRKGHESNYLIFFDPLDGSSNIDVNISIGTIFSIYRRKSPRGGPAVAQDYLRCGREQVAAGYFLYGTSTMLVYTAGDGVYGFTLDPSTREFRMSHPRIVTPPRSKTLSCNEGNSSKWDEATRGYVAALKEPGEGRPYSSRYVGSLVADFHRNLIKGGIFLYPGVVQPAPAPPKGKLRLMYEANPMALVQQQAGGAATDGSVEILDIQAEGIHHRVPLIIGSRDDVGDYLAVR